MDILGSWKVLILIFIFVGGLWGFLVKISAGYLNAFTFTFVALTGAWITVTVGSFVHLRWESGFGIFMAALCGVLAGINGIVFYHAVKKASASVVIPLSSLYILVTVVLSVVFLREALGIKQVLGIICGIAAIVLLTMS
jgi:transporter family protein